MSSLSLRATRGGIWLVFARLIINALAFVSTFVLAWLLEPDDFGLVAIATTVLMIVASVTELSLSQALLRHDALDESYFDSAWTLNTARSVVLAILLAMSSDWIGSLYGDARLRDIIYALSASVVMGGLTNPRLAVFQRKLVFVQEFVLSVGQKLAGLIAALVLAYVYETYWALVAGALVSQATRLVLSYVFLPYAPRFSISRARELFAFSGWLTAGQIVSTLNWRFDELLVGQMFGMRSLGHYTMAGNLAMAPTRELIAPLTQALYPALASVRDDAARLARGYLRAQALVTALTLPVGTGVALIAEPMVQLTLGAKWAPVAFIVQALGAAFALQSLGALTQPLSMALGQTRRLFWRDLQLLLVRAPAVAIGAILGGLGGVVIGRVLSGIVGVGMNLSLARKLSGLSVTSQIASNWRALTSTTIMAVVVALIDWGVFRSSAALTEVCVLSLTGASVYVSTTLLLWGLSGRPDGPERELAQLLSHLSLKSR